MAAEFKEFMSLVISLNFLAIHPSLGMLTTSKVGREGVSAVTSLMAFLDLLKL